MRKRIIIGWLAAASAVILAALYHTYRDRLPPRSPVKVARTISGFPISGSAHVVRSSDQWASLNGSGMTEVLIELDSSELTSMVAIARKRGFKRLGEVRDEFVESQIAPATGGYYWSQGRPDSGTYRLIFLDTATSRLLTKLIVH